MTTDDAERRRSVRRTAISGHWIDVFEAAMPDADEHLLPLWPHPA